MANQKQNHLSWTTAITFAEAGEWQTARSFMPVVRRSRLAAWLERATMAVTFAEAGMVDEALRHTTSPNANLPAATRNFLEICGLDQAHLTYGSVSPMAIGVRA
ncbi:MAG: hypothetical protein HGA96_12205 [Desulfobulbaceae bacterium]|nr:hypothetical protein [Desulfobulbaceae bacterium]